MREFEVTQFHIVLVTFAVLFAVLALGVEGFATVGNLLTLVQNVSVLGILGLAMALVVIGRGIDVSLIAVVAVPVGLILQMAGAGYPLSVVFTVGFGFAIILGLLNGFLVAFAEIPSLFVTLASGLFVAGMGQSEFFSLVTIAWPPELGWLAGIGKGTIYGIPTAALMFAASAFAIGALLKTTQIGQFIYAIGVNPAAAKAAGIPTRPVIVLQYVLCSLVGTFAGLVLAASVDSMPTRVFDSTLIYDVILVIVLGGVSLNGGKGGVANVVAGTLLIGTLLNGMTILNLEYAAQSLIKGIVLLLTIIIDAALNPRNEETSQQGDI